MDRKNGKESIGCKKTRSFGGLYRGQWSARDRWLLSKTNGRGISKEFSLQRTTLLEKFSSVRFWSTTTSSGWSAKRTRANRFRSKLHFPLHLLRWTELRSSDFHLVASTDDFCRQTGVNFFRYEFFFLLFLLKELVVVVVLYIIITFVAKLSISLDCELFFYFYFDTFLKVRLHYNDL